jgi:hypothetical protein
MTALTSVENVKGYLGITATGDDPLLERLVNAASAYIAQYLNREFGEAQYTDTFDGTNGQVWMFRNYPVMSVQSVMVGVNEIPAAPSLQERGYRFDERRLVLQGYTFLQGMLNCAVTYTADFENVPDIEQACIEIVANRYREKDRIGLMSKGLAGETITFSQKDIPNSARDVLRVYRKVVPN